MLTISPTYWNIILWKITFKEQNIKSHPGHDYNDKSSLHMVIGIYYLCCLASFLCFFLRAHFFFFKIHLFLRECKWGRGREKRVPHWQQWAQCRAQIHKLQDQDLSWSQTFNRSTYWATQVPHMCLFLRKPLLTSSQLCRWILIIQVNLNFISLSIEVGSWMGG